MIRYGCVTIAWLMLTKLLWILESADAGVLWRSVHLGEDLRWESLWELEEGCGATGSFNSLLFGFGKGFDVAVHGVCIQLVRTGTCRASWQWCIQKTIAIFGAIVMVYEA
jgi:hypothetical protein